MGVSLKTEKRRSHCPVFSFRPRVRRAEGLPGMTTEDLHGNERRSAPPALLPLICMVIPDHSSFSVLRETPMTFACGHFKKLFWDPSIDDFGECVIQEGRMAYLITDASLIHHQDIICCVACVRSSLRRIGPYASVVAPWRLASDALLVIRNVPKPVDSYKEP